MRRFAARVAGNLQSFGTGRHGTESRVAAVQRRWEAERPRLSTEARRIKAKQRALRDRKHVFLPSSEGVQVNWTRPPRVRKVSPKMRAVIEKKKMLLKQLKADGKQKRQDKEIEKMNAEEVEEAGGEPKDWFKRRKGLPAGTLLSPSLALMPGDSPLVDGRVPVVTIKSGTWLNRRDPVLVNKFLSIATRRQIFRHNLPGIPNGSLIHGFSERIMEENPSIRQLIAPLDLEEVPQAQAAIGGEVTESVSQTTEGEVTEKKSSVMEVWTPHGLTPPPGADAQTALDFPYAYGSVVQLQTAGDSPVVIGWGCINGGSSRTYKLDYSVDTFCRVFEWAPIKRSKPQPWDKPPLLAADCPERTFGEEYWLERVRKAYEMRMTFIGKTTNAYRLINGLGDGIPNLLCDIYGAVAVIIIGPTPRPAYRAVVAWLKDGMQIENIFVCEQSNRRFLVPATEDEVEAQRAERRAKAGAEGESAPQPAPPPSKHGWLRLKSDINWVSGSAPSVVFKEFGVEYTWYANQVKHSRSGFDLLHRAARQTLAALSHKKTVLDLAARDAGFGVAALHGEASQLIIVDKNEDACNRLMSHFDRVYSRSEWTKRCRIECAPYDQYLKAAERAQRSFDIVVLDPHTQHRLNTKLALEKDEDSNVKSSREARIPYLRALIASAIKCVRKGGLFFAFTKVRDFTPEDLVKMIERQAGSLHRSVTVLRRFGPSVDFPEDIENPQKVHYYGILCMIR
eukprot:Hpha_TRINITY_DN3179_c0_g1::TRINITY_DN3179_c0_g1_i1::g.96743::m.96743/K06969/rlmI; 23S rRNA (cytosine1962-C5)-methyltransferase